MSQPYRSPVRGSVGNGGDPTHPEVTHRSPPPDEVLDPEDPWVEDLERSHPFFENLDKLRLKYLPLPDEVVYEFLGEEEFVVHSDHPSFRAFLTQNIILVTLIPIVGPLLVYFGLGAIVRWETVIAFVLVALIIFALALRRIGDRYTSYVITNMRLIKVTGILRRRVDSIPWTGMTGMGFNQTAWGRIMGYATIRIESANEVSGLNEFSDVSDPVLFHQRLLDMASARNRAAAARQAQRPGPPDAKRKRRSGRRQRKAAAGGGAEPGRRPIGRTGGTAGPAEPAGPEQPRVPREREGPPGRETFGDLAEDPWPDDDAEAPWDDEDPEPSFLSDDADAPWDDAPDDNDITPPEGQPRIITDEDATDPPRRTKSGRPRPRARSSPTGPETPPTGQPRVPDASADADEAAAPRGARPGRAEQDPGRKRRWLRWPGADTPAARSEAPDATEEEANDRSGRRSGRRDRKPAQQAPQKPETIVVPRQAPPAPPPSGRPPRGRRRP